MPASRKNDSTTSRRRMPANTPEERESQLVDLAYDTAETQMRNGTASAQVLSHFLKMGTARENLEREKLRHENELLQARRQSLEREGDILEMYQKAMTAMTTYQGREVEPEPEDYDA